MADFFISYRGTDVQWAQWIAWQLQQAGSEVIYQAADFRAGPPLIDQINQALAAARCTIAVISPTYFESPWCKIEWQTAYTLDVTDSGHRLLLVVIKPTDLPPVLKARAWVELSGLDEAGAKERLLSAASTEKKLKGLSPCFPNGVWRAGDVSPLMTPEKSGASQPPLAKRHHDPLPGLAPVSPPDRFPGRSQIWNVPHPWNPNFVGRDGLLAELRNSLVAGDRAAVTQVVTGLGGVGKTQLATTYAYQHATDYELVWWVNSETPAGLAADFAGLAGPLGLPQQDERDLNVKAQAVRRHLEAISGWLIIFDNVEDPEHLTGYLPQNARGHVIITSRHPHWRHMAKPLVVPTLARPDSIELLHRRSGQQDPVAADKLAELLGDLPVALIQAAGYIERTNKSIAAYLSLFEQHRAQLWKKDKRPDGYQRTVAETLTLSLAKVARHSRSAADLLRLCAYLAPDKIPLDILSQHADQVDGRLGKVLADPIELDAAIEELRSYSLVEVSDLHLSMHRLVQAVVRDRLPPAAQKTWCAAAVQVINAAFPGDSLTKLNSWPICDRLVDHALFATEHAERLASVPGPAGRLANEAGVYFQQRAQFREAEPLLRRALAIDEQSCGPDVAIRLNNLAQVLQATNRLAEAEPLMRRVVDILENPGGEPYPNYAGALNNLAALLKATNRLAEAEPLMRRVVDILENPGGEPYPNYAGALSNLAALLKATDRLLEAEPLMRRALAICEKAYDENHPHVAVAIHNLAGLLQATNRQAEAEPLMRRALAIFVACLGDQHPHTVTVRRSLDELLTAMGKSRQNFL